MEITSMNEKKEDLIVIKSSTNNKSQSLNLKDSIYN